ncbi:MAG: energy-coupling factor transporter transmembrane component T [Lachnospiraceae bacterium]
MLRDITIGQYYPGNSLIHRLDPRVKLVGTLLFIVSVFLFQHPLGILLASIFLISYIALSKIPIKYILSGLKTILILLLFTSVFNLLFTPGDPIFHWGIIRISVQGVKSTLFMMVRLIYLILGTSVMTLTTTPNRLTDGMERLLWPLHFIKVPIHEIAMMMSIALRFIPILVEETDKIMKAQIARGADFESGNFLKRAKNMIPLLVPLFVSAWRRATDLAMAMESRCYRGGEGRTKMKPLKYAGRDYLVYGVVLLYFTIMIFIKVVL